MAAMIIIALGGPKMVWLTSGGRDRGGEQRGGYGGYFLEEFGAPSAILASGIKNGNTHLRIAGVLGSVAQTNAVFLVALVYVYKKSMAQFVIVLCLEILQVLILVHGRPRTRTAFQAVLGQYAAVCVPIGVEISETVFLILGGLSWRESWLPMMILAFLDMLAPFVVVIPWVLKKYYEPWRKPCQDIRDGFCGGARRRDEETP